LFKKHCSTALAFNARQAAGSSIGMPHGSKKSIYTLRIAGYCSVMRAVVQRTKHASVSVGGNLRSSIGTGLLVLVGVEEGDEERDALWLASKIVTLRIFNDANGVMNLSVADAGGEILAVSQFTLFASYRKGARPYYGRSALPEKAIPLYDSFVRGLESGLGKSVGTGEFGAEMEVELVNDGPVTIILDSRNQE
jgi:D-tyrosyl-tRNA(Tyr) deacylase